jgi:predicted dehydrogenase
MNKTIVVGAIGIRNMGFANIRALLRQENVILKALCDIDSNELQKKAQWLEQNTGKKPDTYSDFRKLLDDKDIDAVIISTPDHWHCLMSILAMEAGKHVYVEKPMANSIGEAILMEQAVKKYKKVLTVGQWQRSGPHWQDAIDYVWSGKLGKISRVKAWANTQKHVLPIKPDGAVPAGVDYDMWLGPAPLRPFNPNRFHYNFRYFWEYAGGLMADWGVHMLDYALYGMKVDLPSRVVAMGGNHCRPQDARETPDTLNVLYDYKDFTVEWEHSILLGQKKFNQSTAGIVFQGNDGMLVLHRGGWEVRPEHKGTDKQAIEAVPFTKGGGDLDKHMLDFLNSIRSNNRDTKANVTVGKDVSILTHLGNMAFRTGAILEPVADANTFTLKGNAEANELIMPTYRSPWTLPEF